MLLSIYWYKQVEIKDYQTATKQAEVFLVSNIDNQTINYLFDHINEETEQRTLEILANELIEKRISIESIIALKKQEIPFETWNRYKKSSPLNDVTFIRTLKKNESVSTLNLVKLREIQSAWNTYSLNVKNAISSQGVIDPLLFISSYISLNQEIDVIIQ